MIELGLCLNLLMISQAAMCGGLVFPLPPTHTHHSYGPVLHPLSLSEFNPFKGTNSVLQHSICSPCLQSVLNICVISSSQTLKRDSKDNAHLGIMAYNIGIPSAPVVLSENFTLVSIMYREKNFELHVTLT